jgi:hypothetical protein
MRAEGNGVDASANVPRTSGSSNMALHHPSIPLPSAACCIGLVRSSFFFLTLLFLLRLCRRFLPKSADKKIEGQTR